MSERATAFPLAWPAGFARTQKRERGSRWRHCKRSEMPSQLRKRAVGGPELAFKGTLRNHLAERFTAEAERRKMTPAELAAYLLETIIEDDLFAAVLDV